jgi:hypothetical protein
MNHILRCSAIALAGCALASVPNPALAQGSGIKLSDVAGTWEGRSMVGPKDSVFQTWVLTGTADANGWTVKRGSRDPLPVRVVAVGGDSIVWQAGPYPSVLKPGQTVTTGRNVGHVKGDRMTGTWAARYASGGVARGKIDATRKK